MKKNTVSPPKKAIKRFGARNMNVFPSRYEGNALEIPSEVWTKTAFSNKEITYHFTYISLNCFRFLFEDWVEIESLGTMASNELTVPVPDDEWVWIIVGTISVRGTEVLGEEPAPVSLRSLQITHGQPWDWTRASAIRSGRLTALTN
jgi:hypothetical protein